MVDPDQQLEISTMMVRVLRAVGDQRASIAFDAIAGALVALAVETPEHRPLIEHKLRSTADIVKRMGDSDPAAAAQVVIDAAWALVATGASDAQH